jgi:hypothetical protein
VAWVASELYRPSGRRLSAKLVPTLWILLLHFGNPLHWFFTWKELNSTQPLIPAINTTVDLTLKTQWLQKHGFLFVQISISCYVYVLIKYLPGEHTHCLIIRALIHDVLFWTTPRQCCHICTCRKYKCRMLLWNIDNNLTDKTMALPKSSRHEPS